jgi:hypothetical protein
LDKYRHATGQLAQDASCVLFGGVSHINAADLNNNHKPAAIAALQHLPELSANNTVKRRVRIQNS